MVMGSLLSDDTDQQDDQNQPQPQPTQNDPMASGSWGLGGFGQPGPTPDQQASASQAVQQQAAAQPPATDLSGPGSLGERAQNFIQSNGGPDLSARTGWQDFNYGLGAPGRAVSQIPYFNQQPQLLQGAEQATANALPYVVLGPEGLAGKVAAAGTIGSAQTIDQLAQQINPGIPGTSLNYNSLVTPFGGPIGMAGNLLAGKVGGLADERFGPNPPEVATPTPEVPAAQPAAVQSTVPQPEVLQTGTPTYPSANLFQNVDHQAGFYQGALDRQQFPEWRDVPPEFQSRGIGDTDFTQGRKEGFMGMQPGTLMSPAGAGQMTMDEALAGITPSQIQANLARPQPGFESPTGPNAITPDQTAQAIQVQQAAQQGWMNQSGSNPYQPGNPTGQAAGVARGLDGNALHNFMDLVGAPTQPLLAGLHTARFAPQEALRPGVLGNGMEGLAKMLFTGNADDVIAHVNSDLGPNIPQGLRASDMLAAAGNPPVNPTYVRNAINNIPVVGPILQRLGQANSTFLGIMRDAHYNYAADRLARTVPDATPQMFQDLWREASNATGHSTLPFLQGNSTAQGMGIGWSALAARAQELGNTVLGSGAPIPGLAAGSRAEAFKTLMGIAATMASTTALAKAMGASVNTTNPFNNYGLDSTFLKPVTNNGLAKTVYGTGGAGYDTLFKAAANIGNDLFNNDQKAALDHALAFGRGEFGVVPAGVIDSILGQDWKGDKYSWQDFINEAKTGFMADQNGNFGQGRSVPIAAGENIQAVKAYGFPEGVARALPADVASSVQTSPITSGSQAFKYTAPPDIMAKAFPDSPMLQQALAGKDWTELLPNEKKDITMTLTQSNPQLAQQIQDQSRALNPASAAHSDAVTALQDRKISAENYLLDQYNSGHMDASAIKNAFRVVESDYYNSKAKADADPAYQAELAKFQSSGTDPSTAQKYVDAYYQISQHFATDKAARQSEEAKYVNWVNQQDPQMAVRLVAAIQPKNQTELEKLYYSGALNGVR